MLHIMMKTIWKTSNIELLSFRYAVVFYLLFLAGKIITLDLPVYFVVLVAICRMSFFSLPMTHPYSQPLTL